MRNFAIVLLAIVFAASSACTEKKAPKTVQANEDTTGQKVVASETPAPPLDSTAKKMAFITYMNPGDVHKFIASNDGEWSEEMIFRESEDAESRTIQARCVNKMILGGRYQESKHNADFNGQPFEGVSTLGYDNARKVFVSTWIDNMGTGLMYMEGPWDEASKTARMSGKMTDHETGKDVDVRQEIRFLDPNNQVKSMFMTKNGKELKYLEIKSVRKKAVK